MALKSSVAKRTLDNITVVIIAFNNMKKGINCKSSRYNSLASNTSSKRPDPFEPNLDLTFDDLDPACSYLKNSEHKRPNAQGVDQFASSTEENKTKYTSEGNTRNESLTRKGRTHGDDPDASYHSEEIKKPQPPAAPGEPLRVSRQNFSPQEKTKSGQASLSLYGERRRIAGLNSLPRDGGTSY